MEGKETELDKTIIEAIKDPLTHLVRNAVDHGVESPETRKAAGKDPEGLLFLRAFHEGGQVNIEITDDGAGLDCGKIRNKAVQKGLITSDQAARMSDRELTNLIFMPGLSTAEKVTNVSGRGVGMDVVKTNIEKIGGMVDVQSRVGQGTTVRMKIPLTLAIIPALIVTSAGDRYAIPQVNLLELVRLEGEQVRKGIELVNGAPVYRLRGHLLPLAYLNKELGVDVAITNEAGEATNIVVLQADDQQFGLVVDEINDTEEIVVKPLSKQLKNINTYAGATIMGDGRVALILDVVGLAHCANVVREVHDRTAGEANEGTEPGASAASRGGRRTVLLFRNGERERMAIDLALVSRLEEVPLAMVEYSGPQEMIQYRGNIIPLIRVADILGSVRAKQDDNRTGSLQVVVYSDNGRTVGLVIDQILDIVDESFTIQPRTGRRGVLGSAVIQQRTTEVLDVRAVVAASQSSEASMAAHA
jgi:two-component system, chemotaxis family, sensor kinase CheA